MSECSHYTHIYVQCTVCIRYTKRWENKAKRKTQERRINCVRERVGLVRRVRSTGGWLVAARGAHTRLPFSIYRINLKHLCFHFASKLKKRNYFIIGSLLSFNISSFIHLLLLFTLFTLFTHLTHSSINSIKCLCKRSHRCA